MKQKLRWEEKIGILFFIISLGMLAISCYLCFSTDIWYDELFTIGFASRPIKELIFLTARDVHPPLYYLIVHLFVKLAGNQVANQIFLAKLSSLLPFFLCSVLAMTKARKQFGILTAGLLSFLVVAMPQLAAYTVEIRMYGYALFFVTAGMLYACELTGIEGKNKKKLFCFMKLTICAVFSCYTHYFACVAACMIYLYLAVNCFFKIKRKEKVFKELGSLFGSGMICVICYLPWLVNVVTAQVGKVSENYWIQPVSLRTLGGCVKFVFKPLFINETVNTVLAVLLFVLYGVLVLTAVFSLFGKKNRQDIQEDREAGFALGCVFVLLGVILFGMAASLLIRPIFVYRYMIPALGVFWLAFAVLIAKWKDKKAVFLAALIFVGILGIRNFRAFYGEEMWKRVQMEQTEKALEQIGEEDVLLFNFDQLQATISCYLVNDSYLWYGEPEKLIQEMYPNTHALVEGEFSDEAGIESIKALLEEGKTVWFLGSGNAREEICEKWQQQGIATEEVTSVLLERYWFNLYCVTYD